MSGKIDKNKSPRSKSPNKCIKTNKKKPIRNVYELTQFKRMIGKGLVKIWNGIIIDKKCNLEETKKIKEKVLDGSIKSIGLVGYCNNGVIYIISGVDRLSIINSISYQELKKVSIDTEVIVSQYSKLSKEDINLLI
jgi:hypothetical protein